MPFGERSVRASDSRRSSSMVEHAAEFAGMLDHEVSDELPKLG